MHSRYSVFLSNMLLVGNLNSKSFAYSLFVVPSVWRSGATFPWFGGRGVAQGAKLVRSGESFGEAEEPTPRTTNIPYNKARQQTNETSLKGSVVRGGERSPAPTKKLRPATSQLTNYEVQQKGK